MGYKWTIPRAWWREIIKKVLPPSDKDESVCRIIISMNDDDKS